MISNLTTTNMFNPWSTLTDSIEFCDFLQDGHGCLIDGNRLWLTALTSSLFLLSVKLEIRTSVIVHWCVFFRPIHTLFDSPLCYHPLTGIIISFPVEKLILHTHWLPFFFRWIVQTDPSPPSFHFISLALKLHNSMIVCCWFEKSRVWDCFRMQFLLGVPWI